MRKTLGLAIVISALMSSSYPAAAGSHDRRYKIVPFPVTQNDGSGKVVILDQRTGTLWGWSDAEGVSYLSRIVDPVPPGAFARIIHVDR